MKLYLLFQTDIYKTKSSRVCFGAFESSELAHEEAAKNSLYSNDSEIEVIETELNEFVEL